MTHDAYILTAVQAALAAGEAILDVYHGDIAVTHKADRSPLTEADTRSHRIIVEALRKLEVPVLSEEGKEIPYSRRRGWSTLWIVDPLDGTKEFIKRNGEFTVNIAWVREGEPEWGVIFVPEKGSLYFGGREMGAYRLQTGDGGFSAGGSDSSQPASLAELTARSTRLAVSQKDLDCYTIVGSRSHPSDALNAFVAEKQGRYGEVAFVSAGSSLKFCLLAEGRAHIYPRLGPTMEWDTAAGHAVAEGAGCTVFQYDGHRRLRYNKEDLHNPWFIVSAPHEAQSSEEAQ